MLIKNEQPVPVFDHVFYDEKKKANILWGNRFETETGYIFEGFNPGLKLVNLINILKQICLTLALIR